MKQHIVIIGGGVGGLFTGAFLSKEGYRVTVLEKNRIVGGGLQCFQRHGESFETGMHILGGFQPGGSLSKICHYLGILPELNIRPTDNDAIDSITYRCDGTTYRIPRGRAAFTAYLTQSFPAEREGILRYLHELYAITEEVHLYHLRRGDDQITRHSANFIMPADAFIAKHITNSRLRDLLAYMSPMYGGVAGHTPAYVHALINVLYIEGSSQFAGGSTQLADALCHLIEAHGGSIVAGDAVTSIQVADRMVQSVLTQQGREYTADWYISDVHPCTLFSLTGDKAFPKAYRTRLQTLPNSYSCFTVYIKFKPESHPYVNHPQYYQDCEGTVWHLCPDTDDRWPTGLMCITPPAREQGKWASRMVVNCIMSFDDVRQWEATTVGHRGADYEAWKENRKQRVLHKLEEFMPGTLSHIDFCLASSPLTIRDYFGTKNGALYGFMRNSQDFMRSQITIGTKVRNLLLTGQNVNLHGICGVPLTAIEVTEALVGRGVVVDKINQAYTTFEPQP